MHSKHPTVHPSDIEPEPSPRRISAGAVIGRLALVLVLGLAFVGYLTPNMRIQWANLMTLCGF